MNAATRPSADPVTYRHPRSLLEAFGPDAESAIAIHGPYTSAHGEPVQRADRIVLIFCAAVTAALLAMTALGWV